MSEAALGYEIRTTGLKNHTWSFGKRSVSDEARQLGRLKLECGPAIGSAPHGFCTQSPQAKSLPHMVSPSNTRLFELSAQCQHVSHPPLLINGGRVNGVSGGAGIQGTESSRLLAAEWGPGVAGCLIAGQAVRNSLPPLRPLHSLRRHRWLI